MPSHSRTERAALADLLESLGPAAPTLCGDWTTRDLAAHLVVRERRPDVALGGFVPKLGGWAERTRTGVRDGTAWEQLLGQLREGGPVWSPLSLADSAVNLLEFFVHHEDVRRAQPSWGPRGLPSALEDELWSRLRLLGAVATRKWPGGLVAVAPGGRRLQLRNGAPEVTVTGAPSELVLFFTGRQAVARVDLDGTPDAVAALRTTPFRI
jgi:uncharacterized protein (TIGR03085 family)